MLQRSAVTPLEFEQPSPTLPLTDGRRGELAGDAPGLWRQALLNSGSALTPFPADAHLLVPGRSSKRGLDAAPGAPPTQHAPPPNDFGASPPAAETSWQRLLSQHTADSKPSTRIPSLTAPRTPLHEPPPAGDSFQARPGDDIFAAAKPLNTKAKDTSALRKWAAVAVGGRARAQRVAVAWELGSL
jgi:hypothetical protein